jgi:CheY-like chemotaxis protein
MGRQIGVEKHSRLRQLVLVHVALAGDPARHALPADRTTPQRMCGEVLQAPRRSVSIAKSSRGGRDCRGAAFDVILMDLKLPDSDSCTFVPQLAAVATPVPCRSSR